MNVVHLVCLVCGKTYAPEEVEYVCPDHGDDGMFPTRPCRRGCARELDAALDRWLSAGVLEQDPQRVGVLLHDLVRTDRVDMRLPMRDQRIQIELPLLHGTEDGQIHVASPDHHE